MSVPSTRVLPLFLPCCDICAEYRSQQLQGQELCFHCCILLQFPIMPRELKQV